MLNGEVRPIRSLQGLLHRGDPLLGATVDLGRHPMAACSRSWKSSYSSKAGTSSEQAMIRQVARVRGPGRAPLPHNPRRQYCWPPRLRGRRNRRSMGACPKFQWVRFEVAHGSRGLRRDPQTRTISPSWRRDWRSPGQSEQIEKARTPLLLVGLAGFEPTTP